MREISLPLTTWKFREKRPDREEILEKELKIHPVLSRILARRGITEPDEARKFLYPSLYDLPSPFLMKDMKKGVDRLIHAIYNHEKVLIYGDYDADGITGVSILMRFLSGITPHLEFYIPDRIDEGYGLNTEVISRFKQQGVSLIITVDCGISDMEEVSYAHALGIDVIILDHHEVPAIVPPAAAVINPKQSTCAFPFKHLAAVGIAFNFLIALRGRLRAAGFWTSRPYPNLKEYLDLVALGTIGDICSLTGENRIFVKIGLNLITEAKRVGIKALKEVAGLANEVIDVNRASFALVPRINAAGRVGSPREAVELLTSEDYPHALELARRLEGYNRKRQAMEREILEEIVSKIKGSLDLSGRKSFVMASQNWHPGIIGIVASRIADRFGRPTILISLKDGVGKGSGRSINNFNIYEGLQRLSPLLISFGGHQSAAGISILEKDIASFSQLFEEIVDEKSAAMKVTPHTFIDAHCHLMHLNLDLMDQLVLLAPFGQDNPEPVLWTKEVSVTDISVVGNNHLRLKVKGDNAVHTSIWFNQGDLSRFINEGLFSIAFTPQINEWNGFSEVQLMMRDLFFHE